MFFVCTLYCLFLHSHELCFLCEGLICVRLLTFWICSVFVLFALLFPWNVFFVLRIICIRLHVDILLCALWLQCLERLDCNDNLCLNNLIYLQFCLSLYFVQCYFIAYMNMCVLHMSYSFECFCVVFYGLSLFLFIFKIKQVI